MLYYSIRAAIILLLPTNKRLKTPKKKSVNHGHGPSLLAAVFVGVRMSCVCAAGGLAVIGTKKETNRRHCKRKNKTQRFMQLPVPMTQQIF
jgi:hypothetical protein